LTWREAGEGEQLVAGLFQTVGDGAMLQAPFAEEGLALRLDLRLAFCVDHISVIVRYFIFQPLGRVRQQIAVLVHRATLNRHVRPQRGERLLQTRRAVDDDELRRRQSAVDQIVEQRAPSGFAFAVVATT